MSSSHVSNRGIYITLSLIAFVIAAIVFVPAYFPTSATRNTNVTDAKVERLANYDIRTDKNAFQKLTEFRQAASKNAVEVADLRDDFVRGEKALRQRVPALKVEYNDDIKIPEIIGSDVMQGKAFLTERSSVKRSDILIDFLQDITELTGVSTEQVSQLKVVADYKNPEGELAFVELNQEINGVPVFRGEVKAGFTKNNEIIRVINNLAPGLEYASLSKDFGDPQNAVIAAAVSIDYEIDAQETALNKRESTEIKAVFGTGDWTTTAEKMYFPIEPGVAVPAWRVLIWESVGAYYVIVDARTGTMLWRKNLTEDQTQSATYNVYANAGSMLNVADSPFPMTPGPPTPNGEQATGIARTLLTLIGNEAPYTFNNNGWITDGNNTTDGNNVQAGLDRELPNSGSPANPGDIDPNGMAVGSPNRTFDFPFNPGIPTNPALNTGDAPLPAAQTTSCQAQGTATAPSDYQKAVVTQLFYITNRYHDEMYRLGFTEQARNFQNDNFGRGGNAGDRVSAQAQDCSGTNNANFTTPSDGTRGTMQMYLFTAPTPDYDGSLDADIVIHELTHGLSNRLHGNGGGLSLNLSRGMGEGWSDFYAHAMLSEPTDPINGIYVTGGYATYRLRGAPNTFNNYYYGIRRFPKAVKAFTGPNGLPHNPMTFKDIDSTQANVTDGAFPAAFSATADQVHAAGEVWSTALWEVRARYIQNQGAGVDGNRKVLQLVTDGMKLSPLGPTFLTARDAILAAALAGGSSQDVADVWAGFASRGMGFSASIQTPGSGGGTARVTEAFDLPNLQQAPTFSVSDSAGDNDGFFEPGEPLNLTVPLTNTTGSTATGVTLQLIGGTSANYGTINHNTTAAQVIQYVVPANAPCGSTLTLTFNVNSNIGPTSFQRSLQIGQFFTTAAENFDGITAPAFPAGWTAVAVQNGINFVTTTNNADSAPNAAFAADPTTVGGGTDLTMAAVAVTAPAAVLSFRNRYDTEPGWDGGVVEISINGGTFQDIITAGGSFIENGYNGALGAGANNPLANRAAWNGNSNGYVTTRLRLPASAAGQNVQFRFRFGADDNTTGTGPNPGWYIDNIQFSGQASCSFTTSQTARADFDGDGKTDLSIYRPADNGWYVNRSNGGIDVIQWGLAGDRVVPGRYDNDNKTDFAVFRPSENRWYVLGSNGYTVSIYQWGLAGDLPVPGDYDNDGMNDPAIFRPSENRWYVQNSNGGIQVLEWGIIGDVPVPGDYNGDGATDFAVYRNGQWLIAFVGGGIAVSDWGLAGDKPVPADYDGDNKDDLAIFRPSNNTWHIQRSSNGAIDVYGWGIAGDVPSPGDYDGDGRDEPAVFRNGTWYLFRSTAGILVVDWGLSGDKPIPSAYVPE